MLLQVISFHNALRMRHSQQDGAVGKQGAFCQLLAAATARGEMDWGLGVQTVPLYPRGRTCQASRIDSHFSREQPFFFTPPGLEMLPVWGLVGCIWSF